MASSATRPEDFAALLPRIYTYRSRNMVITVELRHRSKIRYEMRRNFQLKRVESPVSPGARLIIDITKDVATCEELLAQTQATCATYSNLVASRTYSSVAHVLFVAMLSLLLVLLFRVLFLAQSTRG